MRKIRIVAVQRDRSSDEFMIIFKDVAGPDTELFFTGRTPMYIKSAVIAQISMRLGIPIPAIEDFEEANPDTDTYSAWIEIPDGPLVLCKERLLLVQYHEGFCAIEYTSNGVTLNSCVGKSMDEVCRNYLAGFLPQAPWLKGNPMEQIPLSEPGNDSTGMGPLEGMQIVRYGFAENVIRI